MVGGFSIGQAIEGALGNFLYPLFSILMVLIDGIQQLFYAFAGVGEVFINGQKITSGNTGNLTDTGIIFYLLNSNFVRNIFISLLALAVVLLVLFAAIAFVKNMYSEKPKTWQDIIGNAVKGLAGFIVTPLICIFGAWGGNILLKAINQATNAGDTANMAGQLFVVSSYNANKVRTGDMSIEQARSFLTGHQGGNYSADWSAEDYAKEIDNFYSKNPDYYYEIAKVGDCYKTFKINYLLLGIGGVFMLYALGSITFGAIKRMFLLVFYFVISPVAHSLAPIDDGKAGGDVRSNFYKQFISVYGAVAGLNLFFSVVPLFQSMKFVLGSSTQDFLFGGLVNLIIIIVGLLTVNELISFVSGFAGGEDLYGKGKGVMSGVRGQTKKYGKYVQKAGGAFIGGTIRGVGRARESWARNSAENRAIDERNAQRLAQYNQGRAEADQKELSQLTNEERKQLGIESHKLTGVRAGASFLAGTGTSWLKSAGGAINKGVGTAIQETTGLDVGGSASEMGKKFAGFVSENYGTGYDTRKDKTKKADTKALQEAMKSDKDTRYVVNKDGLTIEGNSTVQHAAEEAAVELLKSIKKKAKDDKEADKMLEEYTAKGTQFSQILKALGIDGKKMEDLYPVLDSSVKTRQSAERGIARLDDRTRYAENEEAKVTAAQSFIDAYHIERDGEGRIVGDAARYGITDDADKTNFANIQTASINASGAREIAREIAGSIKETLKNANDTYKSSRTFAEFSDESMAKLNQAMSKLGSKLGDKEDKLIEAIRGMTDKTVRELKEVKKAVTDSAKGRRGSRGSSGGSEDSGTGSST